MKRSFLFAGLLVASTLISAIFFLRASASGITHVNSTAAPSAPAMTFTVNTTADSGAGSLRNAIIQANATPGADVINFDIGINTPSIHVGSVVALPLPSITEAVTIDGATGGATRVELDGTQAGAAADGLTITAGNCIIRGLVINRFSRNGISISGGGSNVLQNNFIGTDAAGAVMLDNAGSGVSIDGSPNNTIGGNAAAVRNLISGNDGNGVQILNAGASNNTVQGNFIGTDVTGTAALRNASGGVLVLAGATGARIGGAAAGTGNLISGNAGFGVRIEATNNQIQGNLVGTTADGLNPLPNGDGVELADSATNNLIGGTGARNIISGNDASGVVIIDSSSANQVQGNFIGTDISGTMALGNASVGVLIDFNAFNNTIGGTAVGNGNVISANFAGVAISLGTGNLVQGNLIGTDVSGAAALGNLGSGVRVLGSGLNNTIGGTLAGAGNTIAFNNLSGINLFGGAQNAVLSNSIFSNAVLGIDLSDDAGITPNDPCDGDTGANNLQNFPNLTSATSGGGTTTIQGSLNSTASTQFRIEFFSNPVCDGSGNGEGAAFIGSTVVSTDPTCLASINVNLPVSVPAGQFITSTATDLQGNTSEFSACVAVTAAPCTILCPADVSADTLPLPFGCGALVGYPAPTTVGGCGSVACAPPSNSFFAVGVTLVTCTAEAGSSCSFTVTVKDTTAPRITCPGNISTSAPPGQNSVAVTYALPTVVDNCSGTTPTCTPPPGSAFALGTSVVTCTATDAANNTSTCTFSVTVIDNQAPTITCPSPVTVNVPAGQCVAVVSYPPPTVADNAPGTIATCAPPSGSTFPLGTTTVNCAAVDPSGNRATCAFTVKVQGQATPGNVEIITVIFGAQTPVPPVRKAKKNPPASCDCSKTFTISNTGCGVLGLDLLSIARTGSDVTSGRITNPDDTKFFSLRIVNPNGSESPFPELCSQSCVQIAPGQSQTFRVVFSPVIPAPSGKTTGLSASQVLPGTVTSKITFSTNSGGSLTVDLIGHVGTALQLINAAKPKKDATASFTKSGNEFILTYAVFDSNLDTNRARYEMFDQGGRLVGQAIEVDLTQPIVDGRVFKGQSFVVEQRFSGAASHPEITSVRLTVFDAESNDSLATELNSSANAASVRAHGTVGPEGLHPRAVKLDRARP